MRAQSHAAGQAHVGVQPNQFAVQMGLAVLNGFAADKIILLGFQRHRIALTTQGKSLLKNVRSAMQSLRVVSAELLNSQYRNEVALAATNSVATLWLLPRLRKFNQRNKQLKIMLIASDDDAECLGEDIDLTILRGDGNWPRYRSRMLFGETVFPVCSPEYLKKNSGAVNLDDIASLSLIGVSSAHVEWMN